MVILLSSKLQLFFVMSLGLWNVIFLMAVAFVFNRSLRSYFLM
ncbi:hypothetical protein [Tychonema sp. LEGE 07203]|nr:hypothetical protein [Tychonema sp. LEGE 07203]